ncbi:MAG: hypothetical protein K2X38_21040 [Gemmataceae bacterium]|nr:hypothetical protein [Gemmataceae bacterium]
MAIWAMLLGSILMPLFMALAFLLGRYLGLRRPGYERHSPVIRQHFDLLQGAELNEAAVEATKQRFRHLLEQDAGSVVEASMKPGTNFVVQVRALVELGTEEAGQILERQLGRRLSDDQLEQAWYGIDLANGLRHLRREDSLPLILEHAERAADTPLAALFAAEAASFTGFADLLKHPELDEGKVAWNLLRRVLQGLRQGLSPQVIIEARLAEVFEAVVDAELDGPPIVGRVLHEALRLIRRLDDLASQFEAESPEAEAFQWQKLRLEAIESILIDQRDAIANTWKRILLKGSAADRGELLQGIIDLRLDVSERLLPILENDAAFQPLDLAMLALRWSKEPRAGLWIRSLVQANVPMRRRATMKSRAAPAAKSHLLDAFPYLAALESLRGHPCVESEQMLVLASQDAEPAVRAAAFASMGWWDPFDFHALRSRLEAGRLDLNGDVRQAARGGLARLGERHALQWHRETMHSDDVRLVHEALQSVADEGLTLLMPEVDALREHPNPEIAYHASETISQLNEDFMR